MLNFINSAYIGLRTPISSIRHAIAMFGILKLERWLSLMLYARSTSGGVDDIQQSPLFENAAQRAVMMENLSKILYPDDKKLQDKAYLTGVISRTDTLLAMPMEDVLKQFKLDPEINSALLNNEGELGKMLKLMALQEADDQTELVKLLKELNILESVYYEALISSYTRVI
jgi:EAL and modified HD-GYP domain-containing signal transduction protein